MENENGSLPLCPALVVFIIPPLEVVTSGSELLSVSKSVTGSIKTNVLDIVKVLLHQFISMYIFFLSKWINHCVGYMPSNHPQDICNHF